MSSARPGCSDSGQGGDQWTRVTRMTNRQFFGRSNGSPSVSSPVHQSDQSTERVSEVETI